MDLDDFRIIEAESELTGVSDRAAAIVGAGLIEAQLEDLLLRAMVRDTDAKSLFEGFGPLSSLSAKIRIAECFGLLPPDMCADADLIRKIRNEFAHTYKPLSFDEPKITNWVNTFNSLSFVRTQFREFREDPTRWADIEKRGWNRPRFLYQAAVSSAQGSIAAWGKSKSPRDPLRPGYAEIKPRP